MAKLYAAKFPDGSHATYRTWNDCSRAVTGVKGVIYKSFLTEEEMSTWLNLKTAVHVDDGKGIRAYVDGTYSKKRGEAGWAFVVVDGDNHIHEEYGLVPGSADSNNIDGECYAAMHAILWMIPIYKNAKIVHDYIGISAWLTGEYKAESSIAKKYVAMCGNLVDNITFVKVKGHTNNRWNEYVDKLAKKAFA